MKNRKLRRREKMTPDDTYRKIRVNGVEHVLYPTLYVTMNRRILAARIGKDGEFVRKDGELVPYQAAGYVDIERIRKKEGDA
jgi:hypothetical protein